MENWLACRVGKGQMGAEYMIEGQTFDGLKFTLFAPTEFVEVSQNPTGWDLVPGRILVSRLGEENGYFWIRLPRESFEMGYVVRVGSSQLTPTTQLQEA
ncbi:MAG: hypothetical protein JWN70_5542 [Planctomycetaceae bacterium]|nr:hypothetical protein [Planctomycetaceae bacterium]